MTFSMFIIRNSLAGQRRLQPAESQYRFERTARMATCMEQIAEYTEDLLSHFFLACPRAGSGVIPSGVLIEKFLRRRPQWMLSLARTSTIFPGSDFAYAVRRNSQPHKKPSDNSKSSEAGRGQSRSENPIVLTGAKY